MEKFCISNHPDFYEAWPDLTKCRDSERLVTVFCECTHHGNREHSRIVYCISDDRGRTWSRHYLTDSSKGTGFFYDSPRISTLHDGTLIIIVPTHAMEGGEMNTEQHKAYTFKSSDQGETWSEPEPLPGHGIAPDRIVELKNGRMIYSAHNYQDGELGQFLFYSDDAGKTWVGPVTVARKKGYQLCEGCLIELADGTLVDLLRENSLKGLDCQKVVSHDHGETWGPVTSIPLPGCHRPVAGFLQDGTVMILFRLCQGGLGWVGWYTQNFLGAFTNTETLLSEDRSGAQTRIFPIDHDRSPLSDLGYCGWVQFPDGEIYVANYIVDDAWDKGQIRGYSFYKNEFLFDEKPAKN